MYNKKKQRKGFLTSFPGSEKKKSRSGRQFLENRKSCVSFFGFNFATWIKKKIVEKWLSLEPRHPTLGQGEVETSQISVLTVFSRIKRFRIIYLAHSKKKLDIKNLSNRTSDILRKGFLRNFEGWFLTLFSTLSEAMDKFLPKDLLKMQFFPFFFVENRCVSTVGNFHAKQAS